MDYQFEVVPAGAPQGSGTVVRTPLDTVNITGLTPSTSYDFYVREICGRGDTSIWIGPFTFGTSNGLPFFEDFESFPNAISANPWPNGWTSTTSANPNWISTIGDGAVNSSTGTGPFVDHTLGGAINGMYIYMETSGGTNGAIADFVSPSVFIDPTATTFEVSYWYFMYGAQVDTMHVLLLSNGVYTNLATYVGQQQTAHTDPWLEGKHAVTGFAGQSVQVVFRGVNPPCCAGDIGIDDVKMDVLPPNSAGVTEVIAPTLPICAGTFPTVVAVGNSGTDTLTSVTVVYNVNGLLDSVLYTGSILPGDTAHVNLGNFTFANGVLYDVDFYTNFPNGLADANNNDDTLSFSGLRTGLSGNFTIDSTSAASATNFLSFEDFADAVNDFGLCGPMVVDVAVGSGPYNNQLLLNRIQGSSSTNTITINGNGETIAWGSTDNNQRAVITIDDASWITIDSLVVDANGGTYGWGIQNTNGAHHISILNSTINVPTNSTSTFMAGIVNSGSRTSPTTASDVRDITIDNNTINGGYYSVTATGTFGNNSPNYVITNNTLADFYLYGSYNLYIDSSVIANNDMNRATRTSVSTFYGLFLSSCTRVTANANAIHDNATAVTSTSTAYPIYVAGDAPVGGENYITNNLIYNINSNGTIYAIYDLGANGSYYYNNTISLDDATATGGITRAFYQSSLSTNSAFINNNISVERGGSGVKHGIYLNATTTSINVDYNNVYMNSAGTGAQSYGYFGANMVDLAAWQAGTTYGTNSYEVDPRFVNPANDDFTPNQALINAVGLSVPQVTTDFFGNPWGANPDIGAIEFTPPPVDNVGLSALIAPIESTDTCYGASNDVIVELLNAGGTVIDFTNSTTVITMNVTGAITQTLTTTVNSNAINGGNPLAIGSSVDVNLGSINMTTPGAYNFDGYINTVNDSLRANDSLSAIVTVAAPAGGVINGNDTVCGGDNITLSVAGSVGDVQWQELVGGSFVDIAGETATTYDVTINSTSTYRVVACGVAFSDTLSVFPIIVNAPAVAKNDPVIVSCGQTATDTLIMSGAAGTILEWYDAPVDGNSVNIGDTLLYTHNTATSNASLDTFYVEAKTGNGLDTVSPSAHAIVYSGNARGYHFVAPVDFTITGLEVAIQAGAGNQHVAVIRTNGNVAWNLWSAPVVPFTTLYYGVNQSPTGYISVNIPIKAGEVIAILGMRGTGNSYGNAAPITIDGITVPIDRFIMQNDLGTTSPSAAAQIGFEGTTGTGQISRVNFTYSTGCVSPRTMIIGEVNCAVGLDGLSTETAAFSVYPNPSNGLFTLNIETLERENFDMAVRDAQGRTVYTANFNVNGTYRDELDFTSFASGVYYMQIQTETESRIEKLIIK